MRPSYQALIIGCFLCLVMTSIGWIVEYRHSAELREEVNRLNEHLGPDYFARMYHSDPDQSAMSVDPLQKVDEETRKLFQSLLNQPLAWESGLVQYLGVDRIRGDLDPRITMQVWWQKEVADDSGERFRIYLADREREFHSPFASAYIVTDLDNQVLAWHGTDIDGPKVTSIRLEGLTFPATLKYVEGSRFNGDAGHFSRVATKLRLSDK